MDDSYSLRRYLSSSVPKPICVTSSCPSNGVTSSTTSQTFSGNINESSAGDLVQSLTSLCSESVRNDARVLWTSPLDVMSLFDQVPSMAEMFACDGLPAMLKAVETEMADLHILGHAQEGISGVEKRKGNTAVVLRPTNIPPFAADLSSVGDLVVNCKDFESSGSNSNASTTAPCGIAQLFPRPQTGQSTSLPGELRQRTRDPLIVLVGTVVSALTKSIVPVEREFSCEGCKTRIAVSGNYFDLKKPTETPRCPHCYGREGAHVSGSGTPQQDSSALSGAPTAGAGGAKRTRQGFKGYKTTYPEMRLVRQTWADYAECRVQPLKAPSALSSLAQDRDGGGAVTRLPRSVSVTLEDELATACTAGARVMIVGVVGRRWKNVFNRQYPQVELVVRALSVVDLDATQRHNAEEALEISGEEPGIGPLSETLRTTTYALLADAENDQNDEVKKNRFTGYSGGGGDGGKKRITRGDRDVELSQSALGALKRDLSLASRPFFCKALLRSLLLQSACSHLYGLVAPKAGILLASVGGAPLRPKSDLRNRPESAEKLLENVDSRTPPAPEHRVRSTIHCLLVGDPSLGKSHLLRFGAQIANKAVITTGFTSTTAGLTAAATRDKDGSGEWTLEPGALVLSNNGTCVIDELRTLSPSDRTVLHEAAEQQTISIAKAGLVMRLRTQCSLLAACNPPHMSMRGAVPVNRSIEIGIGNALLTRFDLIFLMWDDVCARRDAEIAAHVTRSCVKGIKVKPPLPLDLLRKHVRFARRVGGGGTETRHTVGPLLDDAAADLIGQYYEAHRVRGASPAMADAVPVTVRLLESLIRLTQAHAKLTACDEKAIFASKSVYLRSKSEILRFKGEKSGGLKEGEGLKSPSRMHTIYLSQQLRDFSDELEGDSQSRGEVCYVCDIYDAAFVIYLMERTAHALQLRLSLDVLDQVIERSRALHNFTSEVLTNDDIVKFLLSSNESLEDIKSACTENPSETQEPIPLRELYTSSGFFDSFFTRLDIKGLALQQLILDWIVATVNSLPMRGVRYSGRTSTRLSPEKALELTSFGDEEAQEILSQCLVGDAVSASQRSTLLQEGSPQCKLMGGARLSDNPALQHFATSSKNVKAESGASSALAGFETAYESAGTAGSRPVVVYSSLSQSSSDLGSQKRASATLASARLSAGTHSFQGSGGVSSQQPSSQMTDNRVPTKSRGILPPSLTESHKNNEVILDDEELIIPEDDLDC